MRAEFVDPKTPQGRPSAQIRNGYPFDPGPPHPRATEMAETMREARGARGACTYADLAGAGFSPAEIIEHETAAGRLAEAGFVRQISPPFDRVPDIIEKALVSAAHMIPKVAGVGNDETAVTHWRRYCAARAAFHLDPWVSQGERCLNLLKFFLATKPLLEREANRIIFAIAAAQKAELTRSGK